MLNTNTVNKIGELKKIINSYDESLLSSFEDTLYEIHLSKSEDIIDKLIFLLKDDFEYDEVMFSIVHTIENFEDNIYVCKVLSTLPDSIYSSPRWLSIIFMRILNSGGCLNVLIEEIENLNKNQTISLVKLFEAMSKRGDDLKIKLLPILNLLR